VVKKEIIEAYGTDRVRVSGVEYAHAILVFPDRVLPWDGASFDAVIEAGDVRILLLGTATPLPPASRAALRQAGIVVEVMDRGAACRTYNVLLAEGRQVVAALP